MKSGIERSRLSRIEAVYAQIDELRSKRKGLVKDYISKHCPVKVGDTVIVNGYRHEGKKLMVKEVFFRRNSRGEYFFKAIGNIVKKDGTKSGYRGEWYSNRADKD